MSSIVRTGRRGSGGSASSTSSATTTPRARGAVCFTYDDAYVSKMTVAALAAARGQRNTFLITTDLLGTTNRLTSANVAALAAAGHEIGAHSKDHSNITSLGTAAARATQYDTPKSVLEGIVGVGKVNAWAYPFGARNDTADRELYGRYDRVFGIGQDIGCVIPLDDRHGRLLYGRQSWSQATHGTVLDLIRYAAAQPVVVVIYTHDPGNTSGSFATDPTVGQVTEAYDLSVALGVPSVGVSEVLASGNLVRNGGFEDGLTSWTQPLTLPSGLTVETLTDTPDTGLPGTKSLHIGVTTGTGSNFILEQVVPARPNVAYNSAFRWRAANLGASQQLQYDFVRLDASGTQIAATTSVLNANAGWARSTRTLTTEVNTAAIKLKFLVNGTFTGDVYVDHVDLRPQQHGLFG